MSSDLAELKQFVQAHAVSQNLPADHYRNVLDAVVESSGDRPGSWAYEWSVAAEALRAAGDLHGATQYFVMGRFPFVDGPGRAGALSSAVATFDDWRRSDHTEIEPRTVTIDGETITVWTSGLSATEPRPVLLMTGGIVSPKEQWAAVLPQIRAFGLAGVVADYPGVGESPLRLHANSWTLFSAILDELASEAKVDQTYLLALSFSGHLALRAATHDTRIRGIVGNGTPVQHFFTDQQWQTTVPTITRDTLAHLADVAPERIYDHIREWALTDAELASLDIPFATVVALRDEIIPASDAELVRTHVQEATLLARDDVHGAPAHLADTRLWSLQAVLEMWPDADAGIKEHLASLRRVDSAPSDASG